MSDSIQKNNKKQKKGRGLRYLLYTLMLLFIIGIVSIGATFIYYNSQKTPVSEGDTSGVKIDVPSGSTTGNIALMLKDNNLIKSELVFRLVAKIEGKDGSLKAGSYMLNKSMTPEEIIDEMLQGGTLKETVRFTIPEGYELKQIIEVLATQGIVDRERFTELVNNARNFSEDYPFLSELPEGATLEGFLFPDTYDVYADAMEEDVVERMLDKFDEVYSDDVKQKAEVLGMNINDVVTLASIIEREGMVDEERPIISAVFHNRIAISMKLQSCATVQYVLGERKENLSLEDIKIESNYNTYLHEGLPPGPIASSGSQSIEAAVNPADVDYLYFVSNGDGTHTFTKDYNEFLRAKNNN